MYVLYSAVTIFTRDINILPATRVLFGIGNGICDVGTSIYICIYTAEFCSPTYCDFVGTVVLLTFFGMA